MSAEVVVQNMHAKPEQIFHVNDAWLKDRGIGTVFQEPGNDYCPITIEVDCLLVDGELVVKINGQDVIDKDGNKVGPYQIVGGIVNRSSVQDMSFPSPEELGAKLDSMELYPAGSIALVEPSDASLQSPSGNETVNPVENKQVPPIIPVCGVLTVLGLVGGAWIVEAKRRADLKADKRFGSSAIPKQQTETPSSAQKHADRRKRFEANQDAREKYDKMVQAQKGALKEIEPQIEGLRRRIHVQLVESYDEQPVTSAYRMHYEALKEELRRLEEKRSNILTEYQKTNDEFYK